MTIDNLQDRLAGMNDAWGTAPAVVGGMYDAPPDGDYQALVHAFDVVDGKDRGLFLKLEMQIANDATYGGRIVDELYSMEDPDRIAYLKSMLATLGLDVENTPITAIYPGSETLTALLDTPVAIRIRRSERVDKDGRNYVNTYVNQRLGRPVRQGGNGPLPASDVPASGPADFAHPTSGAVDTDDIPFKWTPALDWAVLKGTLRS